MRKKIFLFFLVYQYHKNNYLINIKNKHIQFIGCKRYFSENEYSIKFFIKTIGIRKILNLIIFLYYFLYINKL